MHFKPDDYEKEAFNKLRRKKGVKSARELMNMTWDGYMKGNKAGLHMDEQFVNLFRFLEGPGKKLKIFKGRDFVLEYMKESIAAAEKYLAEHEPGRVKSADTEEEEENQASKQSEAAAKRRTAILQMVNKKLCIWSDKEWKTLNRAYARFCK